VELRDTPEQARFRDEVRRWLAAHREQAAAAAAARTLEEQVAAARAWQGELFRGGWAGLDWPVVYGGRGVPATLSLVFEEEYARARAPERTVLAVGLHLVGPTLVAHGREAQRARLLPPILRGEEVWCQGFSEPNAGSDLASLRTRAELRGDHFVVTGQKIWTSFAAAADWCLLVARSDPESRGPRGLSFLLVEMRSPGIRVRPLREMTGEAWFNEVHFDGVRVPGANLVGELGRGWDVVRTTLSVERGTSAQHARLLADVERLLELARRAPRGGGRAADDPRLRQRLAQLATEARILRTTAWRNALALQRTGRPGPEGSTLKLAASELEQRVKEAAVEILGPAGLLCAGDPRAPEEGRWCHELLWSRAATIYAGTSEIQRDIIAQRVLGLPRR
jgi:alkylation response protein AidB-like acyl-CoA dehydrogenase